MRSVECELAELDRALVNADDDPVLGVNTSVVEGALGGELLVVLVLGDVDQGKDLSAVILESVNLELVEINDEVFAKEKQAKRQSSVRSSDDTDRAAPR